MIPDSTTMNMRQHQGELDERLAAPLRWLFTEITTCLEADPAALVTVSRALK